MPEQNTASSTTALLLLDCQVGIADEPYAIDATKQATNALAVGHSAGLMVVCSKASFRPGYPEVNLSNPVFGPARAKDLLHGGTTKYVPEFAFVPSDILIDKKRFNAFAGNDLHIILRANGIRSLVMGGFNTSGVVLSTFLTAADEDYDVTVLSDMCADPKPALHEALIRDLFPRSGHVLTVDEWARRLSK